MPLQTNARLLRVQDATSGEEFSGPPQPGEDVWQDLADAYLRERRARQPGPGGDDVVRDRLLIVDLDLGIDWRVGMFVTFQQTDAPESETARVTIVERRTIDDPDIPRDVRTVRLTLETE